MKNGDLPIKNGALPIKNGDLPLKNGDLPIKHGDFPCLCLLVYRNISGWWFGTWLPYDFPYVGNNNPTWRTHIFQRGRSTTNQ